jgi:uncharacterized surface protein with fasciclin (FAS1) repeats
LAKILFCLPLGRHFLECGMRIFCSLALTAAALVTMLVASIAPAVAEMGVTVDGVLMVPSKNFIENAEGAKNLTTLMSAMMTTGFAETVQGDGPFTIFAPLNKAFKKLPKGELETLLKPENEERLTAILAYHVVPGKYSAADLVAAVKAGGGRAELVTLAGNVLEIEQDGRKLEIIDAKGERAVATILDVHQRNGIVHVVDKVLLPGAELADAPGKP